MAPWCHGSGVPPPTAPSPGDGYTVQRHEQPGLCALAGQGLPDEAPHADVGRATVEGFAGMRGSSPPHGDPAPRTVHESSGCLVVGRDEGDTKVGREDTCLLLRTALSNVPNGFEQRRHLLPALTVRTLGQRSVNQLLGEIMTKSRLRRSSIRFLVMLAATVSLATPVSSAAETHDGIGRAYPGNDAPTVPRGVASLEEVPLPLPCSGFCGYGANAKGEYYRKDFGCGTFPIYWVGAGSWVNHSTYMGQRRRVAMYDFYGNKIYTTPYSPSEDYTAFWTDVWSIETCVR